MGKSHCQPYISSGFERATRIAQGFHADFRGPFSCPTPQGFLFYLGIVDDKSRRLFPFLCKSVENWFDIWTNFVARIEAELGRANCISWILTDNGSIFKSARMASFCASKGIIQRHSTPYGQFLDHTAERNMRTVGESALTTMLHGNMPKRAWGWAMLHAADVLNRTTESASSNNKAGTPSTFSRLERWKGRALPTQIKD